MRKGWKMAIDEYLTSMRLLFESGNFGRGGQRRRVSILKLLARDDSPARRVFAGERTNDPEMLEALIQDANRFVRAAAASNESTPQKWLKACATDQIVIVRRALAGNPSTPADGLVLLNYQEDEKIRQLLAEHKNTPVKILARLSHVRRVRVRASVAANVGASQETLERLSRDPSPAVRRSVASNPQASIKILKRLSGDTNETVLDQFKWNANLPRELAIDLAVEGKIFPLFSITDGLIDFESQHLRRLVNSDIDQFRFVVATHSNTPVDLLATLADDDGAKPGRYIGHWIPIKVGVARNPNTPPDVLKKLAANDSVDIKRSVVSNQNCPQDLLGVLAKDENAAVREPIAEREGCPELIARQLAVDVDESVRKAVARNASISTEIREIAQPPKAKPKPKKTKPLVFPAWPPPAVEHEPSPRPCDGLSCPDLVCVADLHFDTEMLWDLGPIARASLEGMSPGGGDLAELYDLDDGIYVAWSENHGWNALGKFGTTEEATEKWRAWYGIDEDWQEGCG